ncbi:hypothetical protein BC938DRAFT_478031 [Jimgerdemannia flammicorona]|uniref:Uncharacterized protein n=1 Tax=Jimgerdemannia flammicorona TaxID=994334 RepID=A0A433QNJ3_9FUNG|nr:hypothetical protein BC938DRAFT_478031 [Jimgerdemannia flammicorona]
MGTPPLTGASTAPFNAIENGLTLTLPAPSTEFSLECEELAVLVLHGDNCILDRRQLNNLDPDDLRSAQDGGETVFASENCLLRPQIEELVLRLSDAISAGGGLRSDDGPGESEGVDLVTFVVATHHVRHLRVDKQGAMLAVGLGDHGRHLDVLVVGATVQAAKLLLRHRGRRVRRQQLGVRVAVLDPLHKRANLLPLEATVDELFVPRAGRESVAVKPDAEVLGKITLLLHYIIEQLGLLLQDVGQLAIVVRSVLVLARQFFAHGDAHLPSLALDEVLQHLVMQLLFARERALRRKIKLSDGVQLVVGRPLE